MDARGGSLPQEAATRPSAKVIPLDANPARKPLGLGIVVDDTEEDGDPLNTNGSRQAREAVAASIACLSPAALDRPLTVRESFDGLEAALAATFDGDEAIFENIKKHRSEIAEIKAAHREAIAELKLTITELRCEVSQMRAIQENARTLSRGEAGVAGPRGIPGPPGEGRVGPAGPRGEPAPIISAWEARPDAFMLVPRHSDGSQGPPIFLREIFAAYDAQANGTEDDDYAD